MISPQALSGGDDAGGGPCFRGGPVFGAGWFEAVFVPDERVFADRPCGVASPKADGILV
ncbi:hypothetical protein GCM10010468_05090 [Actinocorallia longicatena]|uniref:Uncharacterized protein n=1 Tax=Actinocorallia longicatena TaxID=111803 RepID=A0ABP6PXF0_9ACTN